MKTCELCEKEIFAKSNKKKYCEECSHALQRSCITTLSRIYNKSKQRRVSGKKYENSPERLEEIKNKYKNGVTIQILEEFIGGVTK